MNPPAAKTEGVKEGKLGNSSSLVVMLFQRGSFLSTYEAFGVGEGEGKVVTAELEVLNRTEAKVTKGLFTKISSFPKNVFRRSGSPAGPRTKKSLPMVPRTRTNVCWSVWRSGLLRSLAVVVRGWRSTAKRRPLSAASGNCAGTMILRQKPENRSQKIEHTQHL